MDLTVEEAAVSDRTAMDAIARADERTMIYSSPIFADFLSRALRTEVRTLIARVDGRPTGLLHYGASSGRYGRVLNSLPWYGSHGGCTLLPDSPPDVRVALLRRFRELAEQEGVLSSCIVLSPFEEVHRDAYVDEFRPLATDERTGMFSPLSVDEDDQMARMHQKTRNLVRKSLKQGLEVHCDDSDRAWEFLLQTHTENITALGGSPKPRHHFSAMRETIPEENRELLLAVSGSEVVAALLILRFNKTVEYLVPAVSVEHRSTQAMSRLIWEGMRRAAAEGYTWWNWGGTWRSQESLHRFKSRWGSESLPYSYLINCSDESKETISRKAPAVFASHEFFYVFPRGAIDDVG
jgi:hypothetical protein